MIRTFIAMTTYGQIFFSKIFGEGDSDSDISLTAGLISAVYQMTTETEGEKIENLDLENVRTLFRETTGDKLFVITLDKRMDDEDANDLLDDIIERFNLKYGEVQVDGLMLNDFEPEVDEAVKERIWHENVPRIPKWYDLFPALLMLFMAYWYPMWFLDGEKRIILPIMDAFALSIQDGLIETSIISVALIFPLGLLLILFRFMPNTKGMLRFAAEFLRRPTRAGYSEVLPYWYLSIPLAIALAIYSFIRYGRGIYYSLFAQSIGYGTEANTLFAGTNTTAIWYALNIYIFLYLVTWYVGFPLIVGLITQNFNMNFMKSMSIATSLSMIILLPANFFSGVIYQEYMGFSPENATDYSTEILSINFILVVTIPTFLCLLAFAYFLSIGTNRLIKNNQERYPIALSIGILVMLIVQRLIFWYMFSSGLWIFRNPVFS